MEESPTYLWLVERGRLLEARLIVLSLGQSKFGDPTAAQVAAVERIADRKRLRRIALSAISLSCWEDLLNVL
jgi:hypothetical protein